ncbi:MAG: NADPH-dependent glutamate synthase [Candidatus Omnitrophota bacterium]
MSQIKKRQDICRQPPEERIKNFNEVTLGYTEEEAQYEAWRCLLCKDGPCRRGCPVEIDITGFIRRIREKKYKQAYKLIREKNNLPAICGRVCPQEDQCEKFCILSKKGEPVAIGRLERFVADWAFRHGQLNAKKQQNTAVLCNRIKVGVIGAGPAGLTCAADLARMGYRVMIFESLHRSGGVLQYGIPEFRLPKQIVDMEIAEIKKLGVEIEVNFVVGKTQTIEQLRAAGHQAFFIGTGAGLPYFLNIPGENLNGVYSANEFLTRANLMKAYLFPDTDTPIFVGNRVCVIGGGNVAMDSARAAKRLGAENVKIIYRRSKQEMPARAEEVENAGEEDIEFHMLTAPLEIIGDAQGWARKMRGIKNRLGKPDTSGRRRPVPIAGSEFLIECDTVICAIGQGPNPLLLSTIKELKLTRRGNIEADENGRTNIKDIFAGGDIVTGAATVIEAMGAGKRAARAIDEYLKKCLPNKDN